MVLSALFIAFMTAGDNFGRALAFLALLISLHIAELVLLINALFIKQQKVLNEFRVLIAFFLLIGVTQLTKWIFKKSVLAKGIQWAFRLIGLTPT